MFQYTFLAPEETVLEQYEQMVELIGSVNIETEMLPQELDEQLALMVGNREQRRNFLGWLNAESRISPDQLYHFTRVMLEKEKTETTTDTIFRGNSFAKDLLALYLPMNFYEQLFGVAPLESFEHIVEFLKDFDDARKATSILALMIAPIIVSQLPEGGLEVMSSYAIFRKRAQEIEAGRLGWSLEINMEDIRTILTPIERELQMQITRATGEPEKESLLLQANINRVRDKIIYLLESYGDELSEEILENLTSYSEALGQRAELIDEPHVFEIESRVNILSDIAQLRFHNRVIFESQSAEFNKDVLNTTVTEIIAELPQRLAGLQPIVDDGIDLIEQYCREVLALIQMNIFIQNWGLRSSQGGERTLRFSGPDQGSIEEGEDIVVVNTVMELTNRVPKQMSKVLDIINNFDQRGESASAALGEIGNLSKNVSDMGRVLRRWNSIEDIERDACIALAPLVSMENLGMEPIMLRRP